MPRKNNLEQNTDTTESSAAGVEPAPKKRRTTAGKPRCPARPYRRVETEVMKSRIVEYGQKMELLQSKLTLLRQRLDMHNLEMEMRQNDEVVEQDTKTEK